MAISSTFEIAFAGIMRYSQDPDIFDELEKSSVSNSRLFGESMKSINQSRGSSED